MVEALLDRKELEERRLSLRAGMIAAAIYNANPFRKAGSELITAEDFVPQPEPTEEEKLEQFKKFFSAMKQEE